MNYAQGDLCNSSWIPDQHNVSIPGCLLNVAFPKPVLKKADYHNKHGSLFQKTPRRDKEPDHPEIVRLSQAEAWRRAYSLRQELEPGLPSFDQGFKEFLIESPPTKIKLRTLAQGDPGDLALHDDSDFCYHNDIVPHGSPLRFTLRDLGHVVLGNRVVRRFIVDSGASFHMIGRRDLTRAEINRMRPRPPQQLQSANGLVTAEYEVDVTVRELGNRRITCLILEDTPALISLGQLCLQDGYSYCWPAGKPPYLRKDKLKMDPKMVLKAF